MLFFEGMGVIQLPIWEASNWKEMLLAKRGIDKMNRSDTLEVVGAICPLQKVPFQKTPALGG